ncbi:MAG: NAD(+)/NADH kinase [Chloroflexi bacterium]|nr:NAD(+)/NADH kinase [Chloroflexota bacterium]
MKIGILYHPARADSTRLAEQASSYLTKCQVPYWLGTADDEAGLCAAAPELNVVVTLGGDGTIVRAARSLAPFGLPVLGINLGRLGFLAEVEPANLESGLAKLLAGAYRVEERMLLRAELQRGGQVLLATEAINDAVLGRGHTSRTVRVAVDVDGHYVMTQTADAMIVSTPTGSTAYCLSAGGPIVAPDLDCMILTPVAPHISVAHAIVIPASRSIRLRLLKGQNATLTVDGQVDLSVAPEDELVCTTASNKARFIHFGYDGYYYETVLHRLHWPDQGPS